MKKLFVLFALLTLSTGSNSFGHDAEVAHVQSALNELNLQVALNVHPLDLINWKVGDQMEYDMSAMFGKLGGMVKSITKDEGTAIWMKQEADMMGQKDTTEMLLNKADAKVLKYIHNGKEEQMPDQKLEIISQDYVDVTVPAGTFKAMHITAKTEQVSKLEIWANPQATCIDGSLKMVADTSMLTITIELTKFKKN